jgi:hypothetical protein
MKTKYRRMIDLSNLKNSIAAMIGLLGAAVGSTMDAIVSVFKIPVYIGMDICGIFFFIQTDIALQRLAWTVGIFAAIVSIVNGCKNWKLFKKNGTNYKNRTSKN